MTDFSFTRGRGRPIGYHPKKQKKYNRRRNPNKARSKAITWTPDHDKMVEEAIELWPVALKKENLKVRGAASLVASTSMTFFLRYLRWCHAQSQQFSLESQLEFFESTEYAKAMRWFLALQGDIYGTDKSKVLKTIYGDSEFIEDEE